MLTDETNYGKFINKSLAGHLLKYTSEDDRKCVSKRTNVGFYTIKNLLYRSNTLTKNSALAIEELRITALHNCEWVIRDAKIAKQYLNSKNK